MNAENVITAFSEEQVSSLTGLSQRQLRYWDRTGFFVPAYAEADRALAFSRVYSFLDIVALRTLGALRNQYRISLQHLRKVAERMRAMSIDLWRGTTLYVLGGKVIFQEPGTGLPLEIVSKQYVMPIALEQVVTDANRAVRDLMARPEETVGRITQSRSVSANHAVVSGTRVRVASIKRLTEDGYTPAQIIAEFPQLTVADIKAALDYSESRTAA